MFRRADHLTPARRAALYRDNAQGKEVARACRRIWGTGIFSIRCAIPSCRRPASRISGGIEWTIRGHADDRLHARQGAPLGVRRKRGEQKQAVGRSRGGRNTKIHALADAKGRLIAILLTGGEAHDCPIAERLIRRVKPSKRMLGDKAYDSAELRAELIERGTKPVIPNRSNRKQPFRFSKAPLQASLAHRGCIQQAQGLQAHRNALR